MMIAGKDGRPSICDRTFQLRYSSSLLLESKKEAKVLWVEVKGGESDRKKDR